MKNPIYLLRNILLTYIRRILYTTWTWQRERDDDCKIIITMAGQGIPATKALVPLLALLVAAPPCAGFSPVPSATRTSSSLKGNDVHVPSSLNLLERGEDEETEAEKGDVTKNPLELASWYAVEAFGKAFGSKKPAADGQNEDGGDSALSIDFAKPPSSLEETLERIRLDNDRSYFLSGEVDRLVYDEECTFADPFVSFDGRDRFIDNLANLGSFITKYDAKMIKYHVEKGGREINTKVRSFWRLINGRTTDVMRSGIWITGMCVMLPVCSIAQVMVKLELNLPWKPVLAWPWGVSYEIDPETFLVTMHRESWAVEPLEVSVLDNCTISMINGLAC